MIEVQRAKNKTINNNLNLRTVRIKRSKRFWNAANDMIPGKPLKNPKGNLNLWLAPNHLK